MRLIDADNIGVNIYNGIMDYIDQEPTFTTKQEKGRWIPMKRNFFDKIIKRNKYECSNCGVTECDNTNYCPVCGAVMKQKGE